MQRTTTPWALTDTVTDQTQPESHERTLRLLGHSASMQRFARLLARDNAEAEDLVQDSLHAAAHAAGPIHNARAFLLGTLRKLAGRAHRSRTRREQREAAHPEPRPLPAPDDVAEQLEVLQAVLAELQKLPPTQRRIVHLYYLEQVPTEQIAAQHEVSPATVRSNLSRGIERLRQRLDRRYGNRATWALLLAPVSPPVAAAAASSPLKTTLLTSTGAATLSTSSYVLLAAPALLLGAWLLFDGIAAPTPPAPTARTVTEANAATSSSAPAADRSTTTVERHATHDTPITNGASAEKPTGRVVDRHTGESVPFHRLLLRVEDHMTATMTDAEGNFTAEAALPAGTLHVGMPGSDALETARWQPQPTVHPDTPPIAVAVGPTFRIALRGAYGLELESLHARLLSMPGSELDAPTALHAPLRAGAQPWVRFPFADALRHWPETMRLRVADRTGYWTGEAVVRRTLGIEPNPIAIDLEATGAARLELTGAPTEHMMHVHAQVVRASDGKTWNRYLRTQSLPGQAADDRLMRHLPPGEYSWQLTTSQTPRAGTFRVAAGVTTRVAIDVSELQPTFSTTVWVHDPSEAMDLTNAFAMLADPRRRTPSFHARAVRREDHGPGAWAIELKQIPAHGWTMRLGQGLDRLQFEPSSIRIEPGLPTPTVTVHDRGEFQRVSVHIVDAATGEQLPFGKLSYWIDGHGAAPGSSPKIGPARIKLPENTTCRLFAWAPGFRMAQRDWQPGRDGHELTFALEPGWGTCVRVWHEGSRVPGAEVLVDGRVAGTTDEHGTLMLQPARPPQQLSVRKAGLTMREPPEDRQSQLPELTAFGINLHLERVGAAGK